MELKSKVCAKCGSNQLKVVLSQSALIQTDDSAQGFQILKTGQQIIVSKVVTCASCNTPEPALTDPTPMGNCSSCNATVTQAELDVNNGICVVCAAKTKMPALANMSNDDLIRLLLDQQSKLANPVTASTPTSIATTPVDQPPVQMAAPQQVEILTTPMDDGSAPVVTPQVVTYTELNLKAAIADFKAHINTFEPGWSGQKKGGFTRKLNNLYTTALEIETAVTPGTTVVLDLYNGFIKIAEQSEADAAAASVSHQELVVDTPDPFTTAAPEEMVVPQPHDGDQIAPVIDDTTPMAPPSFDDFDPNLIPGANNSDEDVPY